MKKLFAAFALSAAVLTSAAVPAVADPAPAPPTLNFVTAKQCADGGGKVVSGLSVTGQVCQGGKSNGAWVVPDFPKS